MNHQHLGRPLARAIAALGLALTLGASGVLSDPVSIRAMAQPGTGRGGAAAWLDLGASLAAPFQPLLAALDGDQALSEGTDGRLTFLLLGSDTRTSGIARTDTIIIMSVKNGVINAASIPRDMARIPNPFTASTTDVFSGRVNGIAKLMKKQGYTIPQALGRFEIVIEHLLQIEIDYHALLTFNGFMALVDNVDANGIPINIAKVVRDSKFWDDPNQISGAYFPAASAYNLYAWQPNSSPPLCNGLWRNYTTPPSSTWCRRAIVFVRSRKGTGNSDFARARRQQNLVGATAKLVVNRGKEANLTSLLNAANAQSGAGFLTTSLPMPLTIGNATELYNRLSGANLVNQVVFSPTVYATHITGTSSYEPKLAAIRGWTNQYMKE